MLASSLLLPAAAAGLVAAATAFVDVYPEVVSAMLTAQQ